MDAEGIKTAQMRRRAVYTSLKGVLDYDQSMRAMKYWNDKFEAQTNYSLIKYVNAISRGFKLSTEKKHQLRKALYKNILPGAVLDEDPIDELRAYYSKKRQAEPMLQDELIANYSKKKLAEPMLQEEKLPEIKTPIPTPAKANSLPHMGVFNYLLIQIVEQLKKLKPEGHQDFFKLLLKELETSSIPSRVIAYLRKWSNSLDKHIEEELLEKHAASVVQTIYVALCEAVGPVNADRIMSYAVSKAEESPAAADYSPKKFL